MQDNPHPITWLQHAGQRLGLVPSFGGGVAAWQIDGPSGPIDLWRPWDGQSLIISSLASFAMLPWSNRVSQGGFTHEGRFHALKPNRAGMPYPIHGDGWRQAWQLSQPAADTLVMTLTSRRFDNNPHEYTAMQTFRLVEGGVDQRVEVQHLGDESLPYGLGVHPWFPRTPQTRVTAPVKGVWLCGDDMIPTRHTHDFPSSWSLSEGVNANGSLIDNGYTGWGGTARIDWPEHKRRITLAMPELSADDENFCLVYRPLQGPAFCFEPITQPIDAFHLPGQPGLRTLKTGERLSMAMQWRFESTR